MNTKPRDIILSIKPKYWELIKAGKKTVEFRRKWVKDGTQIRQLWFYVSSPVQTISGWAYVRWVKKPLTILWEGGHEEGAIDKETFDTYFDGLTEGYAIILDQIVIVPSLPADAVFPWWNRPPQNFMYVREG